MAGWGEREGGRKEGRKGGRKGRELIPPRIWFGPFGGRFVRLMKGLIFSLSLSLSLSGVGAGRNVAHASFWLCSISKNQWSEADSTEVLPT